MGRKVFISVLGNGFYETCKYTSTDFCSEELRFIQEATLLQIGAQHWTNNDAAIILLTEKAASTNWNLSITERKKQKDADLEAYESLQSRINKLNLSFEVQTIDIPDGKSEEEMWKIFNRLFAKIDDDDELYFDLTHGFRYLPMLVLVFGNYVKFIKKAKVVHISYGNYEARDLNTNEAPIIDLLPISALQDWTFASANYLENGVTNQLSKLSTEKLTPILAQSLGKNTEALNLRNFVKSLEQVVAERRTCRGISIYKSDSFEKLKLASNQITNCLIEPLEPLIEKIKLSFESFDSNANIKNGFAAAQWCFDFGLYQQAATILQENIVSFMCLRHEIRIVDESNRELINQAFTIVINDLPEDLWRTADREKPKLKSILKDSFFSIKLLTDTFRNLTEVRNDFNHAGMRSKRQPLAPTNIISNIKKCLATANEIFILNANIIENNNFQILLNLTNHPSTFWDEVQLQAAAAYGKIVDMPFPAIEAESDETGIELLVNEYVEKITELAKNNQITVHIMGEMTFCFALISRLRQAGITCIASTSTRLVEELGNGQKQVNFNFVRFREYRIS